MRYGVMRAMVLVLGFFLVYSFFAFSHEMDGAHGEKQRETLEPMHCATCEYLREQRERLREGKKPVVNPKLIPEDYWEHDGFSTPQGVWRWPGEYIFVASDRDDSDGDGLRECRYRFDFTDFVNQGNYTEPEVEEFKNEFRLCADLYNQVLEKLGLEFQETEGDDYHLRIEATTSNELGNSNGVATLFGAWHTDSPIFQFRSTYPQFGAHSYLLENDAPLADIKNPFGNPYVYVFPRDSFVDSSGNAARFPIRRTMLHEMGHLLGLRHPFESIYDTRHNLDSGYLIDWLAWDTVSNPPPSQPSTTLGGEDFGKTDWSRGFFNTYMTYDDEPRFSLYPEIPPPVKAFIAHYYGIFDQVTAQQILDGALEEHRQHSPLANGALVEVEPNESSEAFTRMNIGQSVLGAFSHADRNDVAGVETYRDTLDGYSFEVAADDVGRAIDITVSMASTRYENYYYTRNGIEFDGDCMIVVNNPEGEFVGESSVEEFPSFSFTPQRAGAYQLLVRNPRNSERNIYKDYYLTVEYADGEASNAPTLTPTPVTQTPMPVDTPTPIEAIVDIDLKINEVYIVIDDGGGSFEDDERIENPAVGQSVRFVAEIRNNGQQEISGYGFEVYVDGSLIAQNSNASALAPGWRTLWRTPAWSSSQEGLHTLEWVFTLEGDERPSNNRVTLNFPVGEVSRTPTPTSFPTPSPTPTFTNTPTFTLTPTSTPVETSVGDWALYEEGV